MRTLAFDTATEACSIALFDDDRLIGHVHDRIGRGHAEALMPAIAALPGGGRADHIMVGIGPGSFTGLRVGIAAARALAFAWDARLTGFSTLALVAASDRADHGPVADVLVVMEGGHGEWLVQRIGTDGLPIGGSTSLTPDAAIAVAGDVRRVIGTRAADYVARRGIGGDVAAFMLPDARHVRALPPAVLTAEVTPLYARAPDARPAATAGIPVR